MSGPDTLAGVDPESGRRDASPLAAPAPLPVSTPRLVLAGIAVWVVALVVTLLVPTLHTGQRDWWPWCCVAGVVLGLAGFSYVSRGRGNASDV